MVRIAHLRSQSINHSTSWLFTHLAVSHLSNAISISACILKLALPPIKFESDEEDRAIIVVVRCTSRITWSSPKLWTTGTLSHWHLLLILNRNPLNNLWWIQRTCDRVEYLNGVCSHGIAVSMWYLIDVHDRLGHLKISYTRILRA